MSDASLNSLPFDATPAGEADGVVGEMWVDHIAVAVPDLERSLGWYRDVMGFEVLARRTTRGAASSMESAVLKAGDMVMVLVQGESPDSQVSRYIEHFGPGVQHVAIGVRDLKTVVARLKERGLQFNTTIIEGDGIRQAFTARDPGSGMMYEFIERRSPDGRFTDENVRQLFEELERKGAY